MSQAGGKRPGAGRKPGKVSAAKRELVVAAKDMALDMLDVLKGIANDVQAPTAARVSAATAIIERGYGKAPQSLDLSSSDGSMSPRPNVIEFVAPHVSDESEN